MIKKAVLSIIAGSLLFAGSLIKQNEFDLVQSIIPKTKIAKVERTPVDGLYAAFLSNGNVIYVYPYKRLIFFGEIYSNTGINLTNQIKRKWQEEVTKKNLEKLNSKELTKNSFKIDFGKGSKKYAFVLFTDPECPFCRRVDKYLKKVKPDTTFYVNYMPLYFHPHAKKWALQILSSKDKKEAIETIEKTNKDLNVTITKEAKDTLKATEALAKRLGIRGTPTLFVIDIETGKVVGKIDGANIPEIEKWIKRDKNEK